MQGPPLIATRARVAIPFDSCQGKSRTEERRHQEQLFVPVLGYPWPCIATLGEGEVASCRGIKAEAGVLGHDLVGPYRGEDFAIAQNCTPVSM